jgi:hypothetical protein
MESPCGVGQRVSRGTEFLIKDVQKDVQASGPPESRNRREETCGRQRRISPRLFT